MQDDGDKQENWYHPEDDHVPQASSTSSPRKGHDAVTWTASEFIAEHKGLGWFLALYAVIAVIAAGVYGLTRDIFSAVSIVVVGVLFGVLAGRKPQERSFTVDNTGITVGEKFYPYHDFKSFSVDHEGAVGCINLLPLKRFMPELSIYYPPDEEERILDVLADSLPHEQRKEQHVDKLMKRLRF